MDEFAVISLVFVALTLAVSAIGPHDARLLLAKDSFITGLFGVLCLATLAAPKPLMFYFGRKFATDGTPEAVAWWNGLWEFPGFRRVQRNLTIGWGAAYVVEAAVRVVLVYSLSRAVMVTVNNVLPVRGARRAGLHLILASAPPFTAEVKAILGPEARSAGVPCACGVTVR